MGRRSNITLMRQNGLRFSFVGWFLTDADVAVLAEWYSGRARCYGGLGPCEFEKVLRLCPRYAGDAEFWPFLEHVHTLNQRFPNPFPRWPEVPVFINEKNTDTPALRRAVCL